MTSTVNGAAELRAEWEDWHAAREEELRTPHGWLSLTALHWLAAEPTAIEGVPGTWSADADGVLVVADLADGLLVRGPDGVVPVDGEARLHPVDGQPGTLVEVGERLLEIARRTDSHVLRVRDPQAPTRTGFTGVPAFEVDPRWVLDATFTPYDEPRRITVDAVVDGLQHFPTALGEVALTLDGREHSLVALAGKAGGLSLHFRDATNGASTYPGGRILTVADPDERGRVAVDLNRVVNLPCAFTDFATCPLPPAGNVLDVAVEAGEQLP